MNTPLTTVDEARKAAQRILLVAADGDMGAATLAAWTRLRIFAPAARWDGTHCAEAAREEMQRLLHVAEDGIFGRLTTQSWNLLLRLPASAPWPGEAPAASANGWHTVFASSFADPRDIAAFQACKLRGNSDRMCFAFGDNGIGKWGDDCTADRPMCALPPELWVPFGSDARGKLVELALSAELSTVIICELRDTMPHLANITNGAGIDLNPAAVAAIGKTPPLMTPARWRWKETA